jgi:hypothetical protein
MLYIICGKVHVGKDTLVRMVTKRIPTIEHIRPTIQELRRLNDDKDYICISSLEHAKTTKKKLGKDKCLVIYMSAMDSIRTMRAMSIQSYDKCGWDVECARENDIFNKRSINSICDIKIANGGDNEVLFDTFKNIYLIYSKR